MNEHNVAKLRTCCYLYAIKKDGNVPESKEDLIEFVRSGVVDINLKRTGISADQIEEIFVSDRDGQPIRVKWGLLVDPNSPQPVAFEEVGVDGVRLVAGEQLLEVDDDARYDRLWKGKEKVEAFEVDEDSIEGEL